MVSRTRATLRSAEFGFFGRHRLDLSADASPLRVSRHLEGRVGRSGCPGFGPVKITRNARVLTFCSVFSRPRRTSWLIVGKNSCSYTQTTASPAGGTEPQIYQGAILPSNAWVACLLSTEAIHGFDRRMGRALKCPQAARDDTPGRWPYGATMAASGGLHEAPRLGVLDGLRGIAIALVLWYHIWEISWLSPGPLLQFLPATGFIGVQLFFFLSGFVISYPFVRAMLARRPQPSWKDFAWRRFIKIVPSYVLSIAAAYAIGYAQIQPNASVLPDLVTHLLFIHTWFPLRYGTIDGVLWTLAVEVEFYCLFPLIWWCFRRRPGLTAALMIAIAWYWRAALARCCYATLFAQWEENLPGYLDIFAFGMISAYVFTRFGESWRASRLSNAAPLVAIAGVACLVALLESLYAYRFYDQWAGVWQINNRELLGAAFAIVALAWLASPRWWQVLLDNLPLRFMAADFVQSLPLPPNGRARAASAPHSALRRRATFGPAMETRYTQAAFAITIAQAAVVTYCFERPLLKIRLKDASR